MPASRVARALLLTPLLTAAGGSLANAQPSGDLTVNTTAAETVLATSLDRGMPMTQRGAIALTTTTRGGLAAPAVVDMPSSVNGVVNIARWTEDPATGIGKMVNVFHGTAFTDGAERTTISLAQTKAPGGVVLIGTRLGEIIKVNPSAAIDGNVLRPGKLFPGKHPVIWDIAPTTTGNALISTGYATDAGTTGGQIATINYSKTPTITKLLGTPFPNGLARTVGTWRGFTFTGSMYQDQAEVKVRQGDGTWQTLFAGTPKTQQTSPGDYIDSITVRGNHLYVSYASYTQTVYGSGVYSFRLRSANGKVSVTPEGDPKQPVLPYIWGVTPVPSTFGGTDAVAGVGRDGSMSMYDPAAATKVAKIGQSGSFGTAGVTDTRVVLPSDTCWLTTPSGSNACIGTVDISTGAIASVTEATGNPWTQQLIGPTDGDTPVFWSGTRPFTVVKSTTDGKVRASLSYFNRSLLADADTGKWGSFSCTGGLPVAQVEGIGSGDGKTVTGTYPDGSLRIQDEVSPADCVAATTPIIGSRQVRPTEIVHLGDGKFAVGSYSIGGVAPGALSILDARTAVMIPSCGTTSGSICDTEIADKCAGMVPGDGVSAVAAAPDPSGKARYVFAGTNAWSPNQNVPTNAETAHLFRYDLTTGRIDTCISVPGFSVTDLAFDRDGKLFLLSDRGTNGSSYGKTIYRVDDPTGAMTLVDTGLPLPSNGGGSGTLVPLDSGMFAVATGYGNYPGMLFAVDPNRMNATKTGLYRDTLAGTGGPMTVTTNGRWVYNRDGVLYSQSQGVGGPVIWYP
ncbi:hypothetical protein GCM10009810_34080 [Nostocoides vanveenii]|uniref:Uncharacterized protein n=1 Tax=Nostocoides vanveenii TaxID=330835 RepID=A0ABN2L4X0_9MICO